MTNTTKPEAPLVLNPTLRVKITAIWNQRGKGARTATIDAADSPETTELAKFLVNSVIDEEGAIRVSPALGERLVKLGFLVREDEEPGDVDYNFDLPVIAEPLHPYVNRINFDASTPDDAWVVNPCILLQQPGSTTELPKGVEHAAFVNQDDSVIWVVDPGTGVSAPYRLAEGAARKLFEARGTAPSRELIEELVPHAGRMGMELLRRAHVFVPADWVEKRTTEWEAICSRLRVSLQADGFVVLRGLLNPVQLGFVRRYYRAASLAGAFSLDDGQVEKRSAAHNERVSRFIHHQLVGVLNRILPEPVIASYCYTGLYEPGALLARHVDRPQCKWNLSVPLDADPETDRETAWPIYLDVLGDVRQVRLELGDGVFYRGTELPHWRDAQPEGHRTTVCFFHFVDSAFEGSLD